MALFTKKEANNWADAHAKEVLGEGQYKKNKDAVESIMGDFIAGIDRAEAKYAELANHGGAHLILLERADQVHRGYTAEHDDKETDDQLVVAAAMYAADNTDLDTYIPDNLWPWPDGSYPDKRGELDRVRQLTIAGALIAAEIDRLLRAKEMEVANG